MTPLTLLMRSNLAAAADDYQCITALRLSAVRYTAI
jgi:hypothetical protein